VLVGIYEVADKYAIFKIYQPVAEDLQDILKGTKDDDFELMQAAIRAYYGLEPDVDCAIGKLLTSFLITHRHAFIKTSDFERLVQSYPAFGADVTLALQRNNLCRLFAMHDTKCSNGKQSFAVNVAEVRGFFMNSGSYHCIYCAHSLHTSSLPEVPSSDPVQLYTSSW